MSKTDMTFIHAPSVYDFRKKPIFYGPVSDVIPSSPVFEMYPVGFMTISSHLEAAGFKTRIANIAVQMLIFTKEKQEEIDRYILQHLSRGVTSWTGQGGYTGEDVQVLCVCLKLAALEKLMA